MAIVASEILYHPGSDQSQADTAGGKMNSAITLTPGTVGSPIAALTEAERTNGVTRKYKFFAKLADADNTPGQNTVAWPVFWLDGDAVFSMIKAGFSDTYADVSADARYGVGRLKSGQSLTGGSSTSVVVDTRGSGYAHFRDGMKVMIHDQTDPDDATGKKEIATVTTAVYAGDECTLTFSAAVTNSFARTRDKSGVTVYTNVCGVIEYGEVKGVATVGSSSSAHGTTDAAQLSVPSVGGTTQTLTVTFTSTTDFSVVSDRGYTLAAGSKNSTYAPTNPDNGSAYINIPAAFWTNDGGGDWAIGDSAQIAIEPAACPFFIEIDVPSGASVANLELATNRVETFSAAA